MDLKKSFFKVSLGVVISLSFVSYSAMNYSSAQAETKKESKKSKVSKKVLDEGKKVYEANCTLCHGPKGMGDGPAGAALKPKPRNFVKDKFKNGDKLENIIKTVQTGIPGSAMAPWKGVLNDKQITSVAHYVESLRSKSAKK